MRLADVEPATSAFFRCAYALPFIAVAAWFEARNAEPRARRERRIALLAGVFFAADLELWHHAIQAVGAGLSTVIANTQVIIVGGVAWALLGERPSRQTAAAAPLALAGVVLISGVVGSGAYGDAPTAGVVLSLGTAVAYAGYLLLLRASNPRGDRSAGAVLESTFASAVALAVVGALLGELDLRPTWPAHGWLVLLAVSAQAFATIAIAAALPRLPAVTTSILLLAQPVLSVVFAALIVDERPSQTQILGILLVLTGIVIATARRGGAPNPELT